MLPGVDMDGMNAVLEKNSRSALVATRDQESRTLANQRNASHFPPFRLSATPLWRKKMCVHLPSNVRLHGANVGSMSMIG